MDTGINKAIQDGNGNTLIYTAVLAGMLANLIPTPFDGIYFSRQRKLKEDLESGKISVKNYWYHDIGEYYLWTALWYGGIFIGLQALSGNYKTNARLLLGLLSAGVVIGVAQRNIQKDEEMQDLAKQQQAALAKTTNN